MDEGNLSRITDLYSEWKLEQTFDAENNFLKVAAQGYLPAVVAGIFYVLITFGAKAYMENRPRFELRNYLFIWSTFLALFSIAGSVRTAIVALHIYRQHGMYGVVCSQHGYLLPIGKFWAITFTLSKFAEFVDTFFIVARKAKLIFLHWYHHLTVMGYVWICYGGFLAGGLVFMSMNFFVHAIMYSYYALRAYGLKPPRFVNVCITALQILQMVVGCATMVAIYHWGNATTCPSTDLHIAYGCVMYATYLILFAKFFWNSYMAKKVASTKKLADAGHNRAVRGDGSGDATVVAAAASEVRKRK